MKLRKLFDSKTDIAVMACILILFGFFCIFCPGQECGDSFQYIHQYPMREPVYSLFLQLMIVLFKDGFGVAVKIVQNLLAIVCVFWTYKRVSKMYEFGWIFKAGTCAVLLAPHIFTPLASATHLILTDCIMTEGITLSMYYVFFAILLGILTDYYSKENIIKAGIADIVLAFILTLTRGQMAVCFVLWLLVVGYKAIRQKKLKRVLLYMAVVACLFPLKSQITKWYNLAETGYYTDTVSSKPMLLANILYVCEPSDSEYIDDEELSAAFGEVIMKAASDGRNICNAEGGIVEKALFHESCHEPLNFEYIDPAIRNIIYNRYNIDEDQFLELMIREDEICGEIAGNLLPGIAGKYIHSYLYIISLGFIRSIAVEKSIIPYVAVLLYILAVSLTVFLLVRWKKTGKQSKAAMSMITVLIAICGMVCGTSLMIQCLTRYMVYNLPYFYIVGMAILSELRKS